MIDLSPAGVDSGASSINDRGEILGNIGGAPVIWKHGTARYLEPSLFTGVDINNRGEVAGFIQPDMTHAMLWEGGALTLLPEPAGFDQSQGVAINNRGQIVGYVGINVAVGHAALWRDGRVFDLHAVAGVDQSSFAFDINNRGWIVGCGGIVENGAERAVAIVWQP
jgi:probable HAF family extracellular repeat protein